jgi:predicted HTH domain antitoxin
MHATNVRNLKKNPSQALRQAEEAPVLVLKGDKPNALIVHMDKSFTETQQSVKPALAAALFKDGVVSLGAAARVSGTPTQNFLDYLNELGIDVVCPDETTRHETGNLSQWLAR